MNCESDLMPERPLWAPWRIEYITSPKSSECIFCAAAAGKGEDAERVVDRGEHCFTMLNAFPYAPGHVMVAPYRHLGELEALSSEELPELMRLGSRVVAALREAMTPDGFNLGLNLGTVAGAGLAWWGWPGVEPLSPTEETSAAAMNSVIVAARRRRGVSHVRCWA